MKEIDYAQNLLGISQQLIAAQPDNPAAIRKSISCAYYAAFHCLTYAGTRFAFAHDFTQRFASRSFRHKQMHTFLNQQLSPERLKDPRNKYKPYFDAASLRLIATIAEQFVDLQIMRHMADYDHVVMLKFQDADQSITIATNFIENYLKLLNTHPDDLKTLTAILLFKDISVVL